MASPIVLITGSGGHLGHALMMELPKCGLMPVGIDILTTEHATHVGSISDRSFIAGIFERYPTIRHVLHTATLHKPHVGTHSKEEFIETNVRGTLILLEEAVKTGHIESFIFTSTTSTFGAALQTKPGQPATWIDETVRPIPKNIYGATKVAAEDICQLIHNESGMPTLVLKVSRFFPEPDDDEVARQSYDDDNLKVCELLYRRVDVADVVQVQICAMREAKTIGWAKYVISAPPVFSNGLDTLKGLGSEAYKVVERARPKDAAALRAHGWVLPERIDRVYDPSKAITQLCWRPVYTFERAVEKISNGEDWRSDIAIAVGRRGYHASSTGVYTA